MKQLTQNHATLIYFFMSDRFAALCERRTHQCVMYDRDTPSDEHVKSHRTWICRGS